MMSRKRIIRSNLISRRRALMRLPERTQEQKRELDSLAMDELNAVSLSYPMDTAFNATLAIAAIRSIEAGTDINIFLEAAGQVYAAFDEARKGAK